jgi:outer membrane protein assembly factor BamB
MAGPRVPGAARLEKRLSIEPFGGSILTLSDIDGDGRQELLILQSAGQFSSEIEPQSIDPVNRDLYCLTAVDLDGEVLWQQGSPHDRPEVPFITHGGSKSLLAEDVDGDGRIEVLTVHAGHLVVYDGETGEEKASTNLPSDNYITIYTACFDRSARGRQIICKVNNRAYPPWPYANPLMILNSDLTCYAEPFAVEGAGHNMVVIDFDGDGLDEILIGYSLLDHELNEIWKMDFGEDFDYFGNHADSIGVGDINCDGELEILYSGSKDFFVADLQGNVPWKTNAGHSQISHVGPWGDDGEIRIIMSEKNRGLWGLDAGGSILWNRADLNGYVLSGVQWHLEGTPSSWGLFRPQLKPFDNPNFRSKPSWSRKLWPSLIDGNGRLHDVFPWKNSYSHPTMLIRAYRSYDCGLVYQAFPTDINGDGLDEIVISDRQSVWIFSSPDSKE